MYKKLYITLCLAAGISYSLYAADQGNELEVVGLDPVSLQQELTYDAQEDLGNDPSIQFDLSEQSNTFEQEEKQEGSSPQGLEKEEVYEEPEHKEESKQEGQEESKDTQDQNSSSSTNEPVNIQTNESLPVQGDDEYALWNIFTHYSRTQLATIFAGCTLGSYITYKGVTYCYHYFFSSTEEQEQLLLTVKDREVLLGFIDAMAQDLTNIRMGKRKQFVVKHYNLSALSVPLIHECIYLRDVFMNLYNQCDEQGNNVSYLEQFSAECSDAIRQLIAHARVAA